MVVSFKLGVIGKFGCFLVFIIFIEYESIIVNFNFECEYVYNGFILIVFGDFEFVEFGF